MHLFRLVVGNAIARAHIPPHQTNHRVEQRLCDSLGRDAECLLQSCSGHPPTAGHRRDAVAIPAADTLWWQAAHVN